MSGASSGLLVAGVFVAAAACAPADLGSGARPIAGDLPGSLVALAGPNTRLIAGSNGGAVIDGDSGRVTLFDHGPGALVAAAATVSMPVCSVELRRLAIPPQAASADALTIAEAVADCDQFDYGSMLDRLTSFQTPPTKAAIGSNTAIVAGAPSLGIFYFYDADRIRLLRAARKLYIPACVVIPDDIGVPMSPEGFTTGLTIKEAFARCGL